MYTKKITEKVSAPVIPFLLCVDNNKFYPKEEEVLYDRMFVGNTRGVRRNCIMWCDENDIEVHLWGMVEGRGWSSVIKEDSAIKLKGFLPNDELPKVLRQSKIVLNDHFADMRREGFMNLRTLEALFCGCVLLSDYNHEVEELFGDSIVFYHNQEDFLNKLSWLEEHYEKQKEKVLKLQTKLQDEFSLESRVRELVQIAEKL